MSTALELVSRLRAKRRSGTSTVITDKEGVAFLDYLNSAITTVLETNTWNFQQRSDGYLTTVGTYTGTSGNVTASSTTFGLGTYTGGSIATFAGNFRTQVQFSDDTTYGNTIFPAASGLYTGDIVGTFVNAWPGATDGSATWKTMVFEYALPATVRAVTSVWHQESPIVLCFEDGDYTFERVIARPHDNFSDTPEMVMVGGEILKTFNGATGSAAYGLALKVYPVPSEAYVLNYSYIYRQQTLDVLTDELVRVPPAVEDVIVELANARIIASLEKDMERGLALERKVLLDVNRLHKNHKPGAGKTYGMKSFDQMSPGPIVSTWLPRQVESL